MASEAERTDPAEHIDQDDPRYAGFRIQELWLATAVGPDDQEGVLPVDRAVAEHFHLMVGFAMAADQRRLRHLREFAQWASATFGVPVSIRHFVPADDDEVTGRSG